MWIAYYEDWSGFAVFTDEVAALRYAVDRHMSVSHIAEGQDVREQVGQRRAA